MPNTVIEDALVAWIEALPAAQAVSARAYPWARAPQRTVTRPYVLYRRVSGGRIRSLGGPSGVSHPRVQLDVFGRDYEVVRDFARDLRAALDSFSGTMAGRRVQVAIVHDEFDGDEGDAAPVHGDEAAEHRFTLDLTIWFEE
jgi:hypothetical protein